MLSQELKKKKERKWEGRREEKLGASKNRNIIVLEFYLQTILNL